MIKRELILNRQQTTSSISRSPTRSYTDGENMVSAAATNVFKRISTDHDYGEEDD